MLLLNLEQDMTDPRVVIVSDFNGAMTAAESMPHRVSFAFDGADGLLEPAINVGGVDRRLTIKSLASVYREFSDKALERFESRQVAAHRVAELLLSKFTSTNDRKTKMENQVLDQENTDSTADNRTVDPEAFVPAFGTRVTLLADPSKGIPEEHGVVTKVLDDVGFQVQVDPLYRVGEKDDGMRDALLEELGPDPVGTVRERPAGETKSSGKTKAQISEEMKAKKAADKAEREAAKTKAKAEKAAAREQARAERAAGKSTGAGNGATRGGRASKIPKDGVITVLKDRNAREGSKTATHYWPQYKNGAKVSDVLNAGVPLHDVVFNVSKGFISVEAAAEAA